MAFGDREDVAELLFTTKHALSLPELQPIPGSDGKTVSSQSVTHREASTQCS